MSDLEEDYLDLLRNVLSHGDLVPTGATLASTGKKVQAKYIFSSVLSHDLEKGFPLLTTKKVSFNIVREELFWFLSGKTNIKPLQQKGITIWDEWATSEGELGPVYGKQWRDWDGVDQIRNLIRDIKKVKKDPSAREARRLILSSWNVGELPQMALPPCHLLAQWDVSSTGRLHCAMVMRSSDLFLGLPYNIASYALLTHIFALLCDLVPGEINYHLMNCHIYENHFAQAEKQLSRTPKALPTLIGKMAKPWGQWELMNYSPEGPLKGEVAQ